MKFDYCISNPPYQRTRENISEHVNNSSENIFQLFYLTAVEVANITTMIFPGGRWMQRQSKTTYFAQKILDTVTQIWWYPNGEETNITPVFEGVKISDGVSIVTADKTLQPTIMVNGETLQRPMENEVIPLGKLPHGVLEALNSGLSVAARKHTRGFFGLPSNFVENNADAVIPRNIDDDKRDGYVKAWLADDASGSSKRVKPYWLKNDAVIWTPDRKNVFYKWKVYSIQAAVSKRPELAQYLIAETENIFGESWITLGVFDTRDEAANYAAYLNTVFAKYMLFLSKGGNTKTWGLFLPDLVDYSSANPAFTPDNQLPEGHEYIGLTLDQRLQQLFNLSEEELRIIQHNAA